MMEMGPDVEMGRAEELVLGEVAGGAGGGGGGESDGDGVPLS